MGGVDCSTFHTRSCIVYDIPIHAYSTRDGHEQPIKQPNNGVARAITSHAYSPVKLTLTAPWMWQEL